MISNKLNCFIKQAGLFNNHPTVVAAGAHAQAALLDAGAAQEVATRESSISGDCVGFPIVG